MKYIVIFEKEIVLNKITNSISSSEFKSLKNHYKIDEETSNNYFSETAFDFTCIKLPSIENLPENFYTIPLRQFFAENNEEDNFIAFRAKGLLEWRNLTKFCCNCGEKLADHEKLTARQCPECKNIFFPRISPCIIVVVHKDNKVLLARHTYRNQDIYACIAGFMEAGESTEQAVAREVMEETGLKIKNITYRGSQSWPFPDQLMLGFTADYDSGELSLQKEEIADAQWFDPENCPASPKPGSIAYRLIHGLY